MPQWHVQFPGVTILRADMLYTHGVSPSVCTVSCIPHQPILANPKGTITFLEDGAPKLAFIDCAAFRCRVTSATVNRKTVWELDIADRRWKWRYRQVGGRFNIRGDDGEIIESTKATYEELLTHILNEMEEQNPIISLPNVELPDPPPREWNDDRADLALADILSQIGCMVFLGPDNLVYIVPIGEGPIYPITNYQATPPFDMYPADYPHEVKVVGGPTVYLCDLQMKAVGLDDDEEVRILSELSYAKLDGDSFTQDYVPGSTGRAIFGDEATITDEDDSHLAADTIYRWYKVTALEDGSRTLPDGTTFADVNDILPLVTDPAPYAHGVAFNELCQQDVDLPRTYAFTLREDDGLVVFDQYMYKADAAGYREADLNLRAAFYARRNSDSSWERPFGSVIVNPDTTAGTKIYERKDIVHVVSDNPDHNIDATAQLQAAAAAYAYNYYDSPQNTTEWIGIHFFAPAGNIQQLRWVVSEFNTRTYGGKNVENPVFGPTWLQRREREIASEELPC